MDPSSSGCGTSTDDAHRAVLKAAAEKIGWPKAVVAGRALGIACGTEKAGYVATAAEVSRASAGFKVERIVIAFECGAIVNPDGLQNQVEGSVVQGLGGALFEAIEFADGHIRNGSMAQYRVPRFKDMPLIDVDPARSPRPAVRRRRRDVDGRASPRRSATPSAPSARSTPRCRSDCCD